MRLAPENILGNPFQEFTARCRGGKADGLSYTNVVMTGPRPRRTEDNPGRLRFDNLDDRTCLLIAAAMSLNRMLQGGGRHVNYLVLPFSQDTEGETYLIETEYMVYLFPSPPWAGVGVCGAEIRPGRRKRIQAVHADGRSRLRSREPEK